MRMRRSAAAVALAVAVAVPTAVTGVAAYAQGASAQGSSPPAVSVPATKKPKPDRKPSFQASGTITAVDAGAGTLTVAARRGTKDVRGKTVTMSVAANARIVLNGRKVKLGALAAGLRVSVSGTRSGDAYLAARIQASGKVKPAPSPSTSTSPTSAPSPSPSLEPSPSEPPSASPSGPSTDPEPSGSAEPSASSEPAEDD